MKVIIAGGRDFTDRNKFIEEMHALAQTKCKIVITEVVCGMAKGADTLGKDWAETLGIPVKKFYAEWTKHQKPGRKNPAGIIRNTQMADYADALIAFWDGESRGTKHMIETMRKLNKPNVVIPY